MLNDTDKRELEQLVESALRTLTEHFDSVQFVATKAHAGGTICISKGNGNWFARIQSCREFIESDSARTIWIERPKDPPDDDWKKA